MRAQHYYDLSNNLALAPLKLVEHSMGEGGYTPMMSDDDTESANNAKMKHLLVVDDDDVDRERISRYLRKFKAPINVHNASSGAEAIGVIASRKIDLMLLDYQLGDVTGTELLSQLKESINLCIPTIMVTGAGDERSAVEAFRLGVVDYLTKSSITAESLNSILETTLKTADLEMRLRQTQERLRKLSLYDELTGLPNRNLFFDRIHQAALIGKRNDSASTLLMIDLNRFKEINDSLGHLAGDQVLAMIGQRLMATARESDTIARLGGDEFACILHDVTSKEVAIKCAQKLQEAISNPVSVAGKLMQLGASIGIARYPDHGLDVTTLMSNADSAMYHAKKSHRKYVYFNDDTLHGASGHMPIAQYLNQAIDNKEFYLEYQPKVDLQTQKVIGVECLTRWKSPVLGLVMPDDFIPIAERSNMIESLTYAIMEMAFRQLAAWQKSGLDIQVAINLSACMLDNKDLAENVQKLLETHGLQGKDITLEITETTLASSTLAMHHCLDELLGMGLKISIDDFGSGFTSFKYVRDFPFTELKIDRLFIENLKLGSRDSAILRSIVDMAALLNMQAIAEGVETKEQIKLLEELGCTKIQGYGIARPMNANALTSWLETFQSLKLH